MREPHIPDPLPLRGLRRLRYAIYRRCPEWWRAASHTLRIGKLTVVIWPRSLPWMVQWGKRTWWLFDREAR